MEIKYINIYQCHCDLVRYCIHFTVYFKMFFFLFKNRCENKKKKKKLHPHYKLIRRDKWPRFIRLHAYYITTIVINLLLIHQQILPPAFPVELSQRVFFPSFSTTVKNQFKLKL